MEDNKVNQKEAKSILKDVLKFFGVVTLLLVLLFVVSLPAWIILSLMSLIEATLLPVALMFVVAGFLVGKRWGLNKAILVGAVASVLFFILPSIPPMGLLFFVVFDIFYPPQVFEVLVITALFGFSFSGIGALAATYKQLEKRRLYQYLSTVIVSLLLVTFTFPLLSEFTYFGLFCIGSGCEPGGGGCSVLPCPSTPTCRGYRFGFLCISDLERYCKYSRPLDSHEKCSCEAINEYNRGAYRKYCEKDKNCYTNSVEYEFRCTSDMYKTCRETEERLKTEKSCPYCEDSWTERYPKLTEVEKEIVNKQFKGLCTLICQNCNTTLCSYGQLCEYLPLDQINIEND